MAATGHAPAGHGAQVQAIAPADPARTFDVLTPSDPARFYPSFRVIPAVVSVSGQTGAWDASGQTRTLKRVTKKLAAGSRQLTIARTLTSGKRYRIALRIVDDAGNVTTRAISFTAKR